MQYSSLWVRFILLYVILYSVFSQPFGTVVVGIWYSVDAKDMSTGMGPAGLYLGLVSPVPVAFPFRAH